jgi:hypothetical protein
LTDIFAIQSEVAQRVASRLSAQLSPEERKSIEEKPTNNLEAYDLYFQAKQIINPPAIFILWLEFVQGHHPTLDRFGAAREELYRRVEAEPTQPFLMTALAFADA